MLTISKVKKDEIYEVKEILSSVWADTYKYILSEDVINRVTNLWHDAKQLEKQCELKDTLFIVAKEDDQNILGLATANLIDDCTINLGRLYVKIEHQRSGIGSCLLNYIIKDFDSINKIQLEVAVGNSKAINFYAKNGFKERSLKNEEIENEHLELVLMEKYI
ncbi:GNAT family N-acetyltransferase [Clostridium sporogenes]|uniref:N-acetyltransferase n=1 Tax=Clostridium botulinum TaxID=1491 RepID=A0A6M0T0L8_CLOBO|nr:GNAT family N-acetyltransferase [Clostridium sporogenes]NFA61024.1 N-acetyltransferase [Clostridium botulinum]NFI73619.1 GNAT family N-acetyltransferase [Clostridium sporogenes]NFL72925.1 GNAT family N-acetyltransferase [Clostridium sporogenes]NFM25127.1 GNAT family N-acetyltransferase [Clostridium sporogenes]NFP61133.1 GNAT family N-acetyltransferase [Clostridium sporogenes]